MIRLRMVRQSRGLTQIHLCRMTGISPADISAIELGVRPAYPGWRRRIADALGVDDVEWLFEEVDDDAEATSERS
ncbi:helix-turn-helix domain-containing protein [Symbiobacterium thermophilum]|uniref:XRE family transcriptional regulator n=1 Tax=Symbiobacterium thermophilum TaxID=2734 RepID=A0A953IFP1_SYMTR|nr:XRE family transcriptional regulator [Symbiobacterium thermophilum]